MVKCNQPMDVQISLDNVIARDSGEIMGASPFLWTAFFKVDLDAISPELDRQTGQIKWVANVILDTRPGSHGNLTGARVDDHDIVRIPPNLGRYETTLRPITLLGDNFQPAAFIGGLVGCIAVLWEEDLTRDAHIEALHNVFDTALRNTLNDVINQLINELPKVPEEKRKAAARAAAMEAAGWLKTVITFSILGTMRPQDLPATVVDMDDFIGQFGEVWTQEELIERPHREIRREFSREGKWELTGSIFGRQTPCPQRSIEARLEPVPNEGDTATVRVIAHPRGEPGTLLEGKVLVDGREVAEIGQEFTHAFTCRTVGGGTSARFECTRVVAIAEPLQPGEEFTPGMVRWTEKAGQLVNPSPTPDGPIEIPPRGDDIPVNDGGIENKPLTGPNNIRPEPGPGGPIGPGGPDIP